MTKTSLTMTTRVLSSCRRWTNHTHMTRIPGLLRSIQAARLPTVCNFCQKPDIQTEHSTKQSKIDSLQHFKTNTDLTKVNSGSLQELDKAAIDSLYEGLDIDNVKPAVLKASYNLAAYVNESDTLTNLVKLGVDLSLVEKHRAEANHLLKLDFKKDIEPYLLFLHDLQVADSDIAQIFSRNPGIFKVDLDTLLVRVNYLESKKFDSAAIARIVSKAPMILSMTIKELDTHLGYLQREFKLTGEEVRSTLTRLPKIATRNRAGIKQVKFHLKEFMGFSDPELKKLLLSVPKLYIADHRSIESRFDFLHNEMGVTHEAILQWPSVLRSRVAILKPRHGFLSLLGRDQYDPTKENYVSLKALVSGSDVQFCRTVAKTPVQQFNEFMKTL